MHDLPNILLELWDWDTCNHLQDAESSGGKTNVLFRSHGGPWRPTVQLYFPLSRQVGFRASELWKDE